MNDEMAIEIPLTRGMVALVSPEDAERVMQYRWFAQFCRDRFYAARRDSRKTVLLHRFLMNAGSKQCVDHWNCDTLDNRRRNLRIATRAQNMQNQRPKPGRLKGITYDKNRNKWLAHIKVDSVTYHLGRFQTAELAARAYDAAAVKMFGEFARLNFPV